MFSAVCRAIDVRNSYVLKVQKKPRANFHANFFISRVKKVAEISVPFISRLFTECMRFNVRVMVEEIQLTDKPVKCTFGDLPPRAALVLSFIDAEECLTRIIEEARRADKCSGEPSAKRVRTDAPHQLRMHEIAAFFEDQCDAESEECLVIDDLLSFSAAQITERMMHAFGPDLWTQRIQSPWAKNLMFRVLDKNAPLKDFPLAWTRGVVQSDTAYHVIGVCPRHAVNMDLVARPCFIPFAQGPELDFKQVQALCDWELRSLSPLVDVLVESGLRYEKAIEALQAEYHEALRTSSGNGCGVAASHKGIFHTVKTNGEHIADCQVCLGIFADLRRLIVHEGLFGVFQRLFYMLGAQAGHGMCTFILMMFMQIFVGNVYDQAIIGQACMVGPSSIGKTFTYEKIQQAVMKYLQAEECSASLFGNLFGDPVAGMATYMARHNSVLTFSNEVAPKHEAQTLTWGGDGYGERRSAQPPENGKRYEPVHTLVVKVGTGTLGATNTLGDIRDGVSPAIVARWIPISGMKPPAFVHRGWNDPLALSDAKCGRIVFHHILAMLDIQTSGHWLLTRMLLPPIPLLVAAFDTIAAQEGGKVKVPVRAMKAMKPAICAAWKAECTMRLLLSGQKLPMRHLLLASAMPIPYDFLLCMLQTSGSMDCMDEHSAPFGVLGQLAELPEDPMKLRPGLLILSGLDVGNEKGRNEALSHAARGLVVSVKMAVEAMVSSIQQAKHVKNYVCSTALLALQPPRVMTDAAVNVLRILHAMAFEDQLLVDSTRTHVYFSHSLMMWLNGQEVLFINRLMNGEKPKLNDFSNRAVFVPNQEKWSKEQTEEYEFSLLMIKTRLIELSKLRCTGMIPALIACGLEYPRVCDTTPYELDPEVAKFCPPPPSENKESEQDQAKSNKQADTSKPKPTATDYIHDEHALYRLDISPDRCQPPRIALNIMLNPPLGVPPILRVLEEKMRLPRNVPLTVRLTNDGVVHLRPRDNCLKYNEMVTSLQGTQTLDICTPPNDQMLDYVTCFEKDDVTRLLADVYYYNLLLYNLLAAAPELLATVSDDDIFQTAPHIKELSCEWTLNKEQECRRLECGEITTTVRMVVMAFIVYSVDASDRISFPGKFVDRLIERTIIEKKESAGDLIPCIVRFITRRMSVEGLVRRARMVACRIVDRSTDPTNYLYTLVNHYPPAIAEPLVVMIDRFYTKISDRLGFSHSPDAFLAYNKFGKSRKV